MYVATMHGTFLARDRAGNVVQVKPANEAGLELLELPDLKEEILIVAGPLAGFQLLLSDDGVHFIKDGRFLCADPGADLLIADRYAADRWETFRLVAESYDEHTRFCRQVAKLRKAGQPVKLYCGCGAIPREGFLNLDRTEFAPAFMRDHRDEYFVFPFAEMAWGLPDDSVDYIFDEDFIEHIEQLAQIQFLAETLRVLKPGCYHRVNTPNLIEAMKIHSTFKDGFAGVYTGELQWGHIAIFSPASLKEMAELVGYGEVVFTAKSRGVSPYAQYDARPALDRDEITGNIYADLRKQAP